MLSPRQFGQMSAKLHDPEDGGFTIHLHTGEQPTSGYVVSDRDGGQSSRLRTTHGPDIQKYAEKNKEDLMGEDKYLGGWANSSVRPRQAIFDRNTVYPNTPLGAGLSFVNMVNNQQEARYHMDSGQDLKNPVYHPNISQKERLNRMSGASLRLGKSKNL